MKRTERRTISVLRRGIKIRLNEARSECRLSEGERKYNVQSGSGQNRSDRQSVAPVRFPTIAEEASLGRVASAATRSPNSALMDLPSPST